MAAGSGRERGHDGTKAWATKNTKVTKQNLRELRVLRGYNFVAFVATP